MPAPLRFDRVAPGGVTLPFLLAAPFFGLFAAILLALAGESVLMSRWHPMLIGALHLYTIGFLLFSIAGALLQVGPVMTAGRALHSERLAAAIRFALGTGAVLLGCGLFHGLRALLAPAVILLSIALPAWTWLAARGIRRTKAARDLLLALAGLAVGLAIGLRLAAGHAFPAIGLPRQLTDLHAGWMLLGGIAPLIMAVGSVVIPMFQHTKPLPGFVRFLPLASVAGMLLASFPGTVTIGAGIAAGALVTFACSVLFVHANRRGAEDATARLFQFAMLSAIAGVLAGAAAPFFPAWQHRLQWLAGLFLVVGFAGGSVCGMALKIVPFLVRLRLQVLLREHGGSTIALPGLQQLLTQGRARILPPLHAAAVLGLALAVIVPSRGVFLAAVALLGGAQLVLGILLLLAVASGLRVAARVREDGASLRTT